MQRMDAQYLSAVESTDTLGIEYKQFAVAVTMSRLVAISIVATRNCSLVSKYLLPAEDVGQCVVERKLTIPLLHYNIWLLVHKGISACTFVVI